MDADIELDGITYDTTDNRQTQTYYASMSARYLVFMWTDDLPDQDQHLFRWSKWSSLLNTLATVATNVLGRDLHGALPDGYSYREYQNDQEDWFPLDLSDQDSALDCAPVDTIGDIEITHFDVDARFNYNDWGNEKDDEEQVFSLVISVKAFVERPSLTPEREELEAVVRDLLLGDDSVLLGPARRAIVQANEMITDHLQLLHDQSGATHAAKNLAKHFRKLGDEAISFEERKAALLNRRKSAAMEEAADYFSEYDIDEIAQQVGVSERAARVAKKNWEEYARFSMGGFPHTKNDLPLDVVEECGQEDR